MITDSVLQFEVMLNICLILLVICLSSYIGMQGVKLRRCEARLEEIRMTAMRQKAGTRSSVISFDDEDEHKTAA